MGAAGATSAGLALGSSIFELGFGIKNLRDQKGLDRLEKQQIDREVAEIRRLAAFREGQRARQLASIIGTQQAALSGGNIVGGTTAELLRDSAELDAALDREIDQRATQEQILTFDVRKDSLDRAARQRSIQLAVNTAGSLFGAATTATQAGIAQRSTAQASARGGKTTPEQPRNPSAAAG